MGRHSSKDLLLAKPSTNVLYSKMITYDVPKKKQFHEVCERCGKEFDFTGADIKDRLFKCPHCNHEMTFFSCNYM